MLKKFMIYLFLIAIIYSCTEEKIVTVEVEKQYSWKEVTRFTGEDKIIINTGHDENSIYFQQPGYLTVYNLENGKVKLIQYIKSLLPFDINIKLPMKSGYTPIPYNDSIIYLTNLNKILGTGSDIGINLKKIEFTFFKIAHPYLNDEIMAINNNGVLLIHYYDYNGPVSNYKFILVGVNSNMSHPYIDTTFTKKVEIEKSKKGYVGYSLRYFIGIDDYFIIDLGNDGVVKMKQDGSYRFVINEYSGFNFIYRFNNVLYAAGEPDKIYISNDEGESWNKYQVDTWLLSRGKHTIISDSLVGYYQNHIFTQIWEGSNYRLRFLKNDGLEYKEITGIEVLGDSVYVGTLAGLFVKPLATFFDGKE